MDGAERADEIGKPLTGLMGDTKGPQTNQKTCLMRCITGTAVVVVSPAVHSALLH